MFKPYSKESQLNVKAGTKEAAALLKKAFGRKSSGRDSKYGNEKKVKGDRTFDSRMEAEFGELLELRKLAGELADVRYQVCLKLIVHDREVCRYFMDFITIDTEGRWELLETKGFPTPDWRKKWELTKALIPHGSIPGIPPDAKLTLVKKGKKGWIYETQLLDYQ